MTFPAENRPHHTIRNDLAPPQTGFWDYDPRSDDLSWNFPGGAPPGDIFPEDRERLLAAVRKAADLREPGSVVEEVRVGDPHGGREAWIAVYGRRIVGPATRVKVTGLAMDVTAQRGQARQSRLMISELDHRARNAVAVVQAMALQTLRNSDSLADAQRALRERFAAMGRSEALLGEGSWEGATIASVLGETLGCHGVGDRIELRGPSSPLLPDTARGLSMVAHELATNAVKYGALSNPTGRVRVAWSLQAEGSAVTLEWRESGGPPVQAPQRRGFGSLLIHSALGHRRTQVEMRFEEEGLLCVLRGVPVEAPHGTFAAALGRRRA